MAVTQSGNVTPGNLVVWVSDQVIGDGGPKSDIGIQQSGTVTQGHGVEWVTDGVVRDSNSDPLGALPAGGTTLQVLAKQSDTDFDADWETVFNIFQPEAYGALGDGTTDDFDALDACFDAAITYARLHGQATILFTRLYATSGRLNKRPAAGLSIIGQGPETGLLVTGSFQLGALTIDAAGYVPPNRTVTDNVAVGDTVIPVDNASNFTVGGGMQVAQVWPNGLDQTMLFKVVEIDGTDITVEPPITFALSTANTLTATPCILVEGIILNNFAIINDGSPANGFTGQFLDNPKISNIWTQGFDGTDASGFGVQDVYRGSFYNIHDDGSGSPNGSSFNLGFAYMTMSDLENIEGVNGVAAGVSFNGLQLCSARTVRGNFAAGRGIKYAGSCKNRFYDHEVWNNGATGLSLSGFNQANNWFGVRGGNNGAETIWSQGTNNIDNSYHGVDVIGTISIDALSPYADTGNQLYDVVCSGAITVDDTIVAEVHLRTKPELTAIPASSGQSIANTDFTFITFGTVVRDTTSSWNGTNTFTAPAPGYYDVFARVRFNEIVDTAAAIYIVVGSDITVFTRTSADVDYVEFSNTVYVPYGQTIKIGVLQSSGGSALTVNNEGYSTFVTIVQR